MTRCPPLYKRNKKKKKDKKVRKRKKVVALKEKKIIRQTMNNKKDLEREEKLKADHRKIEDMVSKKFLKQKKVFGKVESERMLTRNI